MDPPPDFTTGAVAAAESLWRECPWGLLSQDPRGGGAPDRVAEAGLERAETTQGLEQQSRPWTSSRHRPPYTYGCRRCSRWIPPRTSRPALSPPPRSLWRECPLGASQPETPRGSEAPDRVAEQVLKGGDDPRPRTAVEALDQLRHRLPTPTGVGGVAPDGSRLGLHDRRCRRRRGVSGENAPWGLLSQRLLAAVRAPDRVAGRAGLERRRRPKASNNSRGLGPAPPSPPTPTGVGGVAPDGSRLGLRPALSPPPRSLWRECPLGASQPETPRGVGRRIVWPSGS